MHVRDVIPNGIYGRHMRGRIQAVLVTRKTRFGLAVRPFYESCNVWGVDEGAGAVDLFELPKGNPKLAAAIKARHLLRQVTA